MDQEHISRGPGTSRRLGTFQIGGVPVRLHFSFVLLISFVVVNGLGSNQSPAFYIVYILALFASVVMHELSHSLVGSGYGIKTVEIVMFPTGGVSRLARSPKPSEEIWIALAGPLTNGLMAAVLMGVLAWQGAGTNLFELVEPTDANLVQRIAFANLVLAGFNLLPAFPMDGGRVLRSVLARLKGEEAATRAAAWSGRILALSMGLYGLLTLQFPLVFVAFFVYLGAAQEGAASMGRTLTRGIPVRAAMMTAYHTLSHGSTVRDATNLLLATAQQDFPIVHGEQVIGLLGRSALLRTMAREGPDAYVAAAMDREFPKLSPDMDLAEVLPLMAPTGACALIMQGEQLLGLITSENLSQYLLLRRFGMQASQIRT